MSCLGGIITKEIQKKYYKGLGFQREDFDKLTDTFSGGWRMRIELAKIITTKTMISYC